jgi:hypothetical protein
LDVAEGIWGPTPIIAILTDAGRLGSWGCRVDARSREQQKCRTSSKSCDAKPVEIHLANSPFVYGVTGRETSGRNRTAGTLDLPMGVLHAVCKHEVRVTVAATAFLQVEMGNARQAHRAFSKCVAGVRKVRG